MRPYSDTDDEVTIDWYFTDGPPLPYATSFGSYVWDRDHCGLSGVGEVTDAPQIYRNGSPVGDAILGSTPCGTADQWADGQPQPPAVPTPVDAAGTPLCCQRSPAPPPPPMVPCSLCPGGMALASYDIIVAGATNAICTDCSAINGTHTVTGTGCFYTGSLVTVCGNPSGGAWSMNLFGTGAVRVTWYQAFGSTLSEYRATGWDCMTPITVPLFLDSDTACNLPPTVRVVPSSGPIPPDPLTLLCPLNGLLMALNYRLVIPAVPGPIPPLNVFFPAQTLELGPQGPCVWVGSAQIAVLIGTNTGGRFQFVVSIQPGGSVLLTIMSLHTGVVATYTSFGAWDGMSTIALSLGSMPRGYSLPLNVQMFWPGP